MAAPRTPSLFDDWMQPSSINRGYFSGDTTFSLAAWEPSKLGVIVSGENPVLTSYTLPLVEPPPSLGVLALEAAASISRLAKSMASQWEIGRVALAGLGWTARSEGAPGMGLSSSLPVGDNSRVSSTPSFWEKVFAAA